MSTLRPLQIIHLVKSNLLSPLSKFRPGFLWNLNDLVVREKSTWEDVGKAHDLNAPYFGDRFLTSSVGSSKSGAKNRDVFKAPKAPIEFVLIIDAAQWLEADEHEVFISF